MSTDVEVLFRPGKIGDLALPNRIVMAPMTRELSPNGVPGEDVAAYYRRRAEGGVGLIVTEGTTVDHPVANMNPAGIPNFHGADALAGWQRVAEEVHAAGGKIMPQLWHVGMMRNPQKTNTPELPSVGPSGILKPGKQVGEPLTENEIADLIAAFAQAAADAQRIGFDGVELHGAHGYLIDQFFWDGTNQRNDAWGGDLVARTRFGAEIVRAVRAATAPNFPIVLRYSQWKQQDFSQRLTQTPEELAAFLEPLADAGVDAFHCSTRRFWEAEFEDSSMNLAGWTKKLTGKPVITVGSVGLDNDFIHMYAGQSAGQTGIDQLLERMADDEFDFVAVGRALLADAEWPRKVREGRSEDLTLFTKAALATLD